MEAVPVSSPRPLRFVVLGLALGLAAASPLLAAPPAPAPTTTQPAPAPSPRNLQKVRPGSVLKLGKPLPAPVDLRSDAERQRDAELTKHYRRLAELDVIAAIADQQRDVTLSERVEQVRRKEVQRHQALMMRLRRGGARTTVAADVP